LDLDVNDLKLATLARHWGIRQARPHDALDDALVLSRVLVRTLALARRGGVPLPIRRPWTLAPPVFSSGPAAASDRRGGRPGWVGSLRLAAG